MDKLPQKDTGLVGLAQRRHEAEAAIQAKEDAGQGCAARTAGSPPALAMVALLRGIIEQVT